MVSVVLVEIDPVPTAETVGDIAFLEAQGNNKNGPFRLLVCSIERENNLLLDISALSGGGTCEAHDDYVRGLNGAWNLVSPILPGQDILFVKPGPETGLFEALVETPDCRFVSRGVTEENAQGACGRLLAHDCDRPRNLRAWRIPRTGARAVVFDIGLW